MSLAVSFHVKILILTLVLLVGGLLSYSLVKNGYFPVAKVNGRLISYHTVKENIEVARRLHQSGLAGESAEMDALLSRGHGPVLVQNALDSLIANAVMRTSVPKDILTKARSEVYSNFGARNEPMADSIRTIYGWNLDKFKERILEPQALRQVLISEKGRDGFDSWMIDSKAKADVSIWFLPFEWKDGVLVSK